MADNSPHSDDEFLEQYSDLISGDAVPEVVTQENPEASEPPVREEGGSEEVPEETPKEIPEELKEEIATEAAPKVEESDESEKPEDSNKEKGIENPEQEDSEKKEEPFDYEKAYKDLIAPLKANGKEVTLSPDELRRLAQQGSGMQKLMTDLKPIRKTIKMLEKAGITDKEDVAKVIDLYKQDPSAIANLLKESKLDAYDLSEKANDEDFKYQPKDYSVSDKEIELDEIYNELQTHPNFNDTLDVVTKLDDPSKDYLSQNPSYIKVINTHIENGIYDKVMTEVEKLSMLGRLGNSSRIEAYDLVGQQMYEAGAFDELQEPQQKQEVVPNIVEQQEHQVQKQEQEIIKRKKSLAPTRAVKKNNTPRQIKTLDLSDEEFMKKYADILN